MSEYELPVPPEWREEIGLTYRAPDFVCAAGRILIVELKTEWRSYSKAQIRDFIRLARSLYPNADIDLILLEERRRGAGHDMAGRQRYSEITWSELAGILRSELPTHAMAGRLCSFIDASLPGSARSDRGTAAAEPSARTADLMTTAIDQALHIAPAIQADPRNANLARGIDVRFESEADARAAESGIRKALAEAGYEGVTTWFWRTTSGGFPATPAGRDSGMELRIQPRSSSR